MPSKRNEKGPALAVVKPAEAPPRTMPATNARTLRTHVSRRQAEKMVEAARPIKVSMGRTLLGALSAAFSPDQVSWRIGQVSKAGNSASALSYLDARDVIERLNIVMGADWQVEYLPMRDGTACCRIGLLIDGEWRWRSNGGIVATEGTKSEQKEMALKGTYSDAFKRAAVLWGIGQYLYELPKVWVDVEDNPKTGKKQFTAAAKKKMGTVLANDVHVLRARLAEAFPDPIDDLSPSPSQTKQEPQASTGRASAPAPTSPPLSQSAPKQAAAAPERPAPAKAADPISPEAEVEKALQKMAADRATAEAKKTMQAPLEGSNVKEINPTTSASIVKDRCIDLAPVATIEALETWRKWNEDNGIAKKLTPGDLAALRKAYFERRDQIEDLLAEKARANTDAENRAHGDELGNREPGDEPDELDR